MTERAQKYLHDILNAIELVELFSEGIDNFNAYQTDLKYHHVEDQVIWKIVERHLAPLKLEVQQALTL